jgi:hypothetical protein
MPDEAPPDQFEGLGTSLTKTLKGSDDLAEVGRELAEVGVDALVRDGVLRDVPIIGTLAGLCRVGITVRDWLFVKKLAQFLQALGDVPADQRAGMIVQLEADEDCGRKVGEEIVLLLDRLDSITKAVLMGRAFRAYCLGRIDAVMLQRMNHVIDRILERDLRTLPQYVAAGGVGGIDAFTLQAFVNAGLAFVRDGTSTTTVDANLEICKAMVEHVLDPHE